MTWEEIQVPLQQGFAVCRNHWTDGSVVVMQGDELTFMNPVSGSKRRWRDMWSRIVESSEAASDWKVAEWQPIWGKVDKAVKRETIPDVHEFERNTKRRTDENLRYMFGGK